MGKVNLTTLILVALAGFVAWKYVAPMLAINSPTALPAGGSTSVNQPDVMGSIVNAVDSIFKAVNTVASTQPKTN